MDNEPESNELPRVTAPRPIFMTKAECDEYAEIHRFIRERREKGILEQRVHCRFYNTTNREVDVIWCRDEVRYSKRTQSKMLLGRGRAYLLDITA